MLPLINTVWSHHSILVVCLCPSTFSTVVTGASPSKALAASMVPPTIATADTPHGASETFYWVEYSFVQCAKDPRMWRLVAGTMGKSRCNQVSIVSCGCPQWSPAGRILYWLTLERCWCCFSNRVSALAQCCIKTLPDGIVVAPHHCGLLL